MMEVQCDINGIQSNPPCLSVLFEGCNRIRTLRKLRIFKRAINGGSWEIKRDTAAYDFEEETDEP